MGVCLKEPQELIGSTLSKELNWIDLFRIFHKGFILELIIGYVIVINKRPGKFTVMYEVYFARRCIGIGGGIILQSLGSYEIPEYGSDIQ